MFLHHYPQMSIAWVCIHEKSFAHLWIFLRVNIYCSGRWVGGVGPSWQKEICQVVWSLTKEGISLLTRMDSLLVAPIYMTTIIVVVITVMMMSIVKLSSSLPSSWWLWCRLWLEKWLLGWCNSVPAIKSGLGQKLWCSQLLFVPLMLLYTHYFEHFLGFMLGTF